MPEPDNRNEWRKTVEKGVDIYLYILFGTLGALLAIFAVATVITIFDRIF